MQTLLFDPQATIRQELKEFLFSKADLRETPSLQELARLLAAAPDTTTGVAIIAWDRDQNAFLLALNEVLAAAHHQWSCFLVGEKALVGPDLNSLLANGLSGILVNPSLPADFEEIFVVAAQSAEQSATTSAELNAGRHSGAPSGMDSLLPTANTSANLKTIMALTLSHSPTGILFLDEERRVVWVNAVACSMTGKSAKALVGNVLDAFFPHSLVKTIKQHWRLVTSRNCIEPLHLRYHRSSRTFHIQINPVFDDARLLGISVTMFTLDNDLDPTLNAARRMQDLAAAALKEIDRFNALIEERGIPIEADVLAPLSSIEHSISDIQRSAESVVAPLRGRERMVDVFVVLQKALEAYTPYLTARNLSVALHGEVSDGIELFTHLNVFERVFHNILRNVVRYAQPQTTVDLKIHEQPDGVVHIGVLYHSARPMSRSQLDRLFARESSNLDVQYGGVLSLPAMRDAVESLGGILLFDLIDDGRLGYDLQIPPLKSDRRLSKRRKSAAGILVAIEDRPEAREALEDYARHHRCVVRFANNARELVDALELPGRKSLYVDLIESGDSLPDIHGYAERFGVMSIYCSALFTGDSQVSLEQVSFVPRILTADGPTLSLQKVYPRRLNNVVLIQALGEDETGANIDINPALVTRISAGVIDTTSFVDGDVVVIDAGTNMVGLPDALEAIALSESCRDKEIFVGVSDITLDGAVSLVTRHSTDTEGLEHSELLDWMHKALLSEVHHG